MYPKFIKILNDYLFLFLHKSGPRFSMEKEDKSGDQIQGPAMVVQELEEKKT